MLEVTSKKFIDLKEGELIHLHRSVNDSMISPEMGKPAEPCTATLAVLRKADSLVTIYLGLFFSRSMKRIIYSTQPFRLEQLEEKILESEGFAGEMGFLLENLRIHSADATQRQNVLGSLPFFTSDLDERFRRSNRTLGGEVDVQTIDDISVTSIKTKTDPSGEPDEALIKLLSMV